MNGFRTDKQFNSPRAVEYMAEFLRNDFIPGARNIEGWLALSGRTVKSLNRRSKLGVLWAMLSALFFVAAVSFVYSTVFSVNLSELLPVYYHWLHQLEFLSPGA